MRQRIHTLPLFRAGRVSLLGVWVASFALIFQTLLPLASRSAADEQRALLAEAALIICTAHGLATAPVADLDLPSKPAESAGKTLKCPLCQVWHSLGNAIPASANNILGPVYTTAFETVAFEQAAPARFHRDPLQARAPPLMA